MKNKVFIKFQQYSMYIYACGEVFGAFTNNESFREFLGEDGKGMFSLYEAS